MGRRGTRTGAVRSRLAAAAVAVADASVSVSNCVPVAGTLTSSLSSVLSAADPRRRWPAAGTRAGAMAVLISSLSIASRKKRGLPADGGVWRAGAVHYCIGR